MLIARQRTVTCCYTSLEPMNMRSCALMEANDRLNTFSEGEFSTFRIRVLAANLVSPRPVESYKRVVSPFQWPTTRSRCLPDASRCVSLVVTSALAKLQLWRPVSSSLPTLPASPKVQRRVHGRVLHVRSAIQPAFVVPNGMPIPTVWI